MCDLRVTCVLRESFPAHVTVVPVVIHRTLFTLYRALLTVAMVIQTQS